MIVGILLFLILLALSPSLAIGFALCYGLIYWSLNR